MRFKTQRGRCCAFVLCFVVVQNEIVFGCACTKCLKAKPVEEHQLQVVILVFIVFSHLCT